MAWLFAAALHPSALDVAFFYPKYALLTFFAVAAARVTLIAGRENLHRGRTPPALAWLAPGLLWFLLTAFLIWFAVTANMRWGLLAMVAVGGGLALLPFSRARLLPLAAPIQLLGLVALLGCLILAMTGWLP